MPQRGDFAMPDADRQWVPARRRHRREEGAEDETPAPVPQPPHDTPPVNPFVWINARRRRGRDDGPRVFEGWRV